MKKIISNVNEILEFSQKKDLLKLEKNLLTATTQKINYIFENRAPYKSPSVHKILLSQSTNSKLFVRGFRADIFDNESVLLAFAQRVEEISKLSKDKNEFNGEPVLDVVIKEKEINVRRNFEHSLFIKQAKELSQKFQMKIMNVVIIEPSLLVSPPFEVSISSSEIVINPTVENGNRVEVQDLRSYSLFHDSFIRVRKDTDPRHDSEAFINCGMKKEEMDKAIKTFNYLKNEGNVLDEYCI